MAQPVGVNESPAAKACERLPLRLGDVRSTMAGAGVPHIDVFGRHIEVAAEHDRRVGIDRFVEPSREPVEPHKLGLVERRADYTAVRGVHADEAHATAFGGDHPRLGERFVVADIGRLRGAQRLAKVGDYRVDAAAARDGDAVPSAFAMVHQRVAGLTEHRGRHVCIGQLSLLHQEHVGLGPVEPPCDFLKAGLQRVDIPGRDAHAYRLLDVDRLRVVSPERRLKPATTCLTVTLSQVCSRGLQPAFPPLTRIGLQ